MKNSPIMTFLIYSLKIFVNVYEKSKVGFSHLFIQENRNSTTKVAFVMYCLYGGFCFDKNVRMRCRKNTVLSSELYNSPWYYLETRDRKTLFTFLSIVQRPIKITVCKIYNVNLSLFPNWVNMIYSHTRTLHTIQLNKQKRK